MYSNPCLLLNDVFVQIHFRLLGKKIDRLLDPAIQKFFNTSKMTNSFYLAKDGIFSCHERGAKKKSQSPKGVAPMIITMMT